MCHGFEKLTLYCMDAFCIWLVVMLSGHRIIQICWVWVCSLFVGCIEGFFAYVCIWWRCSKLHMYRSNLIIMFVGLYCMKFGANDCVNALIFYMGVGSLWLRIAIVVVLWLALATICAQKMAPMVEFRKGGLVQLCSILMIWWGQMIQRIMPRLCGEVYVLHESYEGCKWWGVVGMCDPKGIFWCV